MYTERKFDVIIVGSGISGLYLAIKLKEKRLNSIVITKGSIDETNTNLAQGGMAVALSKEDSLELHYKDTIESGAGLADEEIVRMLVSEGRRRVEEFIDTVGIKFDRKNNDFDLSLEGGHSVPRIIHVKDKTGMYIQKSLIGKAIKENIKVVENARVIEIIKERDKVCGVRVLSKGMVKDFFGKNVVLATGGAGQLYKLTTNVRTATGDGIVLAYKAGAVISNLEFIQFHPTVALLPDGSTKLITEAIRGAGAKIVNERGERFVCKYDKRCELATRDIVSRAIFLEIKSGRSKKIFLDLSEVPKELLMEKFEGVSETLEKYGKGKMIEIVPAAHYMNGGIRVNEFGQSSIEGLYAVGEVACTGVHGANRLASNSLLEAVVFSARIAEAISEELEWKPLKIRKNEIINPSFKEKDVEGNYITSIEELKETMWNEVGIVREEKGLQRAIGSFRKTRIKLEKNGKNSKYTEFYNMVVLSELIAIAALVREESRGCHYRSDFPETKEEWRRIISFHS